MRIATLLVLSAIVSCSSREAERPADAPAPVFISDCPSTELPIVGGGCKKVGAVDCGSGFVLDVNRGCNAILPSERCARGTMAVPGDAACRPVAECGEGTWGGIPIAGGATFVDASYVGGASDGSAASPFTTIQAAIEVAAAKTVIAIAEGIYRENVKIDRPVALWGRCPSKVAIVGTGTFALDITAAAEVHGVAVTGPDVAVGVARTTALLDRVWIHNAGDRALDVEDLGRVTEVTLRDSLIEGTAQIGVFVEGSAVLIERSVVRGTRGAKKGEVTEGILARAGETSHTPSELRVLASLIDDNTVYGVLAYDSSAEIVGSVVRGTKRTAASPAAGITAQKLPDGKSAKLTVKQSLVDAHQGVGIDVADATANIDCVTLRDMTGDGAGGVLLERSEARVTNTTLVDIMGAGLTVASGRAELAGLRIARIIPDSVGVGGGGLQVDDKKGAVSEVSLRESLFRDLRAGAIGVWGSRFTATDVAVIGVRALPDGSFGDGIALTTADADGRLDVVDATITRAIVRDTARAAVTLFGGKLRLGQSVLCSPIDINVERRFAFNASGESFENEVALEDLTGNVCGCGTPARCLARSSGITPIQR